MNRRSFLGLLAGTAALPVLAKIALLEPPPPPVLFPSLPLHRPRLDVSGLRIERFVMSLGSHGPVRPGGVDRIAVITQRLFRPDRLLISSGASFDLLHVAANGEPVLEDAVPGHFFDPRAIGTRLLFAAVPAGDEIVLAVHNRSAHWEPFHAALIGSCVRDLLPGELETELKAEREYADKLARGEVPRYDDDDGDEPPDSEG